MNKSTLALAVAFGVFAQQAGAAGFIEDSKASVSSRTMYFESDNHEGGSDQREAATGLKFDYKSGFTQGVVGFGIDAQALAGLHLDGGKGQHPDNNSFSPSDSDGSAEHSWSRASGNVKALFSKTEAHLGGALQPNLPILVANDGRLLPQTFEGGTITSKDLDNVTFNAGQLEHAQGRAGTNSTGLAVNGGTEDSNQFRYAGADWKVTKDLTLQYYYANLQDYYKQHFLGAVHVFPISEGQSFKTDLRYFDSSSDGRNGDPGYRFNNNGGYAKNPGEVDNKTWSAMFTYTLGGSAFLLGHQQVGDDGGFVYLNQGSLLNDAGRNEGAGGSSFYLFTDSMIQQFIRAGENTTFGQYSYDFTGLGVPGLKAAIAYLHGDDIKSATGGSDTSEWERDMRLDYVVQQGPLKGFGTTLRYGSYRGSGTGIADQDQTRLIFNYTYNFL
ncbi:MULTISPECIES: OprD family outer membrane porin [unclassified Pseudomonas]|uniref:OprD family outer membrane porin n=1 Tax=Pseudomonas TaxID=286 RepID=UPI0008714439|nr:MULTISPECIES: OprD family outer membrane porin [unclassified Pseudomonas]SCW61773.1 outer membrane porin, OprD family [Pseudomonas sp. NFACC56-3]SFK92856.1 outer membrane porin, OprD family [Pseudomonas sp. NFACC52]